MDDVTFYYKQEEMFVNYKEKSTFFVAKDINDKGAKQYSAFYNINNFIDYYIKQTPKNHYEILTEDKPCNFHFDIDGKYDEIEFINETQDSIIKKFKKAFEEWFKEHFEYQKFEYNISTASNETKISFHIVIRCDFVFRNNVELGNVLKLYNFSDYCKKHNIKYDDKIYTKNRCFRILHSTKFGVDRPLIPITDTNLKSHLVSFMDGAYSYLISEIKPKEVIKCPIIIKNDDKIILRVLKTLLEYISNPSGNEKIWSLVGRNIKTTLDCDETLNLFIEWSKLYDNFDEDGCISFWKIAKINHDYGLNYLINKAFFFDKSKTIKEIDPEILDYLKNYKIQKGQNDFFHIEDKLNFQDIAKKKKGNRTTEEQAFFEVERKRYALKNINTLIDIDTNDKIIKNDKYVSSKIYNDRNKCIIVSAGLGCGKTYSVIEYINSNIDKYEGIIVLSPRITFAKSVTQRLRNETKLDFKLYSNIKGIIYDEYIVVQVESLCRLNLHTDYSKYLIIADEIESVLYQLSSSTHGENHTFNIQRFEQIINEASKIICLDAFITQRTLQIFRWLKIQYILFHYTIPNIQRTYIMVEDFDFLINKLLQDLQDGKKIYFLCNSKNKIINHVVPMIQKNCPTKKILYYYNNSNTSIDLDEWNFADIIVTTTIITIGINFDKINIFNKLYCYASNRGGLVRDIFQSLYRIRHLIDNQLVINIKEWYTTNDPTNFNYIIQKNKFKNAEKEKIYKSHNIYKWTNKPWYCALKNYNDYENIISSQNFIELFFIFLEKCNYKYTEELIFMEDFVPAGIHEITKKYSEIPEIYHSEYWTMLYKRKQNILLEKNEVEMMEKFYFQKYVICEIDSIIDKTKEYNLSIIWEIYKNFNKSLFIKACYQKGIRLNTLTYKEIIDKEKAVESILTKDYILALPFLEELNTIVDTTDLGSIVKKEQIKNLQDIFMKHKDTNLKFVFNIRERVKLGKAIYDEKQILGIANTILNDWGFTTIKKGNRNRKRVNGKIVDITEYEIQYNNFKSFGDSAPRPAVSIEEIENTLKEINIWDFIRPKSFKQEETIQIEQKKKRLLKENLGE